MRWCCDEKSQTQALDRSPPGLPVKPGRNAAMTHDYKRHGTTPLFAALGTLEEKGIAQCKPQHHHSEWVGLLAPDRPTHTEKHVAAPAFVTTTPPPSPPNAKAWLDRHPRFHIHYTRPRPLG